MKLPLKERDSSGLITVDLEGIYGMRAELGSYSPGRVYDVGCTISSKAFIICIGG
jgi:hypothetical protein